MTTQTGTISRLEHPDIVDPDGAFTVVVETVDAAGTVVEIDANGFDVEVTIAEGEAVSIDGGRVEFVDTTEGNSTYEMTVNVVGGADGATGTVRSWVNAAQPADADFERSAVFSLNDDATASVDGELLTATPGSITDVRHPEAVAPDDQFTVSVETEQTAGTVVELDADAFEYTVATAEDDAVSRQNGRIEFLDHAAGPSTYEIDVDVIDGADGDTGVVRSWTGAQARTDAAAENASLFVIESEASGGADGASAALDIPDAVPPDGEFTIGVQSTASAGTVVEVDPNGFETTLTTQSTDAVRVEDNRIEFVDTGNGDSAYAVGVDITGGRVGDTAAISAWVDAAEAGNAADAQRSELVLGGGGGEPLTAEFDYSPRFASPGTEISFDASPSSGDIDEYDWAFDDGATAQTKQVTHSFDASGQYSVEVTVSGTRDGATVTETTAGTVRIEQDDSLVTGFTISKTKPRTGERIQFDSGIDQATADEENLTVRWTFGDGTTANGTTVSHRYSTADSYTVTLHVDGQTVEQTLTVVTPPVEITDISREIGGTLLPQLGVEEGVEVAVDADGANLDRVELGFAGQRVSNTTPPYEGSFIVDDVSAPAAPLTVRAITEDGAQKRIRQDVPIQRLPEWLEFLLEVAETLDVERTDEGIQITYDPLSSLDVGFTIPNDLVGGEDDPADSSGDYDFGVGMGGIYDPLTNEAELTASGSIAAEVMALAFEIEVALTGTLETTTLELQRATADIDSQLAFDVEPPLVPIPVSIPIPGTDSSIGIVPTIIVSADGTFDFNADLSFETGTVKPGIELEVSIGIELEIPLVPDGELKGIPSGGIDGSFDVGTDDWDLQASFFLAGKVVLDPPILPGITLEQDPIWDQPLTDDAGSATLTASPSSRPRVRRSAAGGTQPHSAIASVDSRSLSTQPISPRETFRLTDRPYEDVQPTLASPSDGRQLIVWGQQDESKSAEAGHDLVAKWYDNGSWGEQFSIAESVYADSDPVCAATESGEILVAWKRLPEDRTTTTTPTTVGEVNEIRDNTEIAYSIYDGSSWSSPTLLTSSSITQRRPTVAAANGEWQLAWEAFDRDGATSTVRSTVISADGSPGPITNRSGAASPDLGSRDDGRVDLAYLVVAAGNVTDVTHEIRDGTTISSERTYSAAGAATVVVGNGRVVWATNVDRNPTLIEATDGITTALTLREDVVEVRELSLSARADQAILSYVSILDGGSTRDLVYRLDRGNGWIFDRRITEDIQDGLRVRYTDLVFTGPASFLSGYSVRDPGTETVSDVFATAQEFGPAYAIDGSVDGGVAGEQTSLTYDLENRGDVDGTEQVTVSILRDGTEIDSITHDPLNSGESLSRSQTVTVGDGGTFSLAVDVPEPSLETEPRHVDLIAARAKLRVDDISARRTGTNEAIVTVTVTNEGGAAATNVPVALADAAGTVQTPTISTIGAQTTATVETTLDPRGLDNSESHAVRIDPDGTLPPQAETTPLERTYLVRPGLRVEDVRYREDAERFVRVLVSNSGPARGGATVTVSDGSDTELNTAELSIPPATVEDGQPVPIHRTVDIATPTLTDGQSVAVEIEPDVSNRRQTDLTSVGTVETVLPGEYHGTDGELAVSATGGSLSAGGEGTIEITAENVGQLTIKKLWTDWGVAVDVPSEVLDKRVGEKGTVTLNWATAQPSATPTVTVSVPDRYVGGTYLVDIVASNGKGVKKTTASLSID